MIQIISLIAIKYLSKGIPRKLAFQHDPLPSTFNWMWKVLGDDRELEAWQIYIPASSGWMFLISNMVCPLLRMSRVFGRVFLSRVQLTDGVGLGAYEKKPEHTLVTALFLPVYIEIWSSVIFQCMWVHQAFSPRLNEMKITVRQISIRTKRSSSCMAGSLAGVKHWFVWRDAIQHCQCSCWLP